MRQTIEVDVLTTAEATVAEVRGGTYLETNPSAIVGTGYAKKHPNDEHDVEVGHALAMARALKQLAESYEKRAWERINPEPVKNTSYTLELTGLVDPEMFSHLWDGVSKS